eukprot:g80591.t1
MRAVISSTDFKMSGQDFMLVVVDEEKSDLCRRYMDICKEIASLPPGHYSPSKDSLEVFQVKLNAKKDNAPVEVEIARIFEIASDEDKAADFARKEIEAEIITCRKEIARIGQEIAFQQLKAEQGVNGVDAAIKVNTQVQNKYMERLKQLREVNKTEVTLQLVRSTNRVVLSIHDTERSVRSETKIISLNRSRASSENMELPRLMTNLEGQVSSPFQSPPTSPTNASLSPLRRESSESKGDPRRLITSPGLEGRQSFSPSPLSASPKEGDIGRVVSNLETQASSNKAESPTTILAKVPLRRTSILDKLSLGPIKEETLKPCLYVLGGHDGTTCLDWCERFNTKTSSWQRMQSMATERRWFASAVWDGRIYAVGGETKSRVFLNTLERYNVASATAQWEPLAPMSTPRGWCAAAALEGCIYVVGGDNGDIDLKSAERYDIQRKVWQKVADMSSKRSGCAAVAFDSRLWVIGGYDGVSRLSSVECFDPKTNSWTAAAPLRYSRNGCAAVVFDGAIYAIGGDTRSTSGTGSAASTSVERYNQILKRWELAPSLNIGRYFTSAAVIDSQLWVSGGKGEQQTLLNTMERLDPASHEKWQLVDQPMSSGRLGHTMVSNFRGEQYQDNKLQPLATVRATLIYRTAVHRTIRDTPLAVNQDDWSAAPISFNLTLVSVMTSHSKYQHRHQISTSMVNDSE